MLTRQNVNNDVSRNLSALYLNIKKNSTFLTQYYTCLHEKLARRLSDFFSNKKFTESDALSQNHLRDVKGMYWGCVYTYYTKSHTLCKLADLFYDQLK